MSMPDPGLPPRLLRRSARVLAIYVIIASIALAALSCFALSRLITVLENADFTPAAFAVWCVKHRTLVMLAWLPAVVLAVSSLAGRSRLWTITSLILSLVLMVAPVLLVMLCFLLLVGPMYDYRPL